MRRSMRRKNSIDKSNSLPFTLCFFTFRQQKSLNTFLILREFHERELKELAEAFEQEVQNLQEQIGAVNSNKHTYCTLSKSWHESNEYSVFNTLFLERIKTLNLPSLDVRSEASISCLGQVPRSGHHLSFQNAFLQRYNVHRWPLIQPDRPQMLYSSSSR